MRALYRHPWFAIVGVFVLVQLVGFLQAQSSGAKRRAKPPKFSPREVDRIFFDDVFGALVGARPANLSAPGAASSPSSVPGATESEQASAPKGAWAALISPSTIEDEVKRIKASVDKDVTTPSDFAGRGYKACRLHFSTLAALFGAIHEYDGDVRWKKNARAARDLFARTAANAKVGTTQVYNEAKLRKQDLQDLIGGSNIDAQAKPEPPKWGDIVDRAPLMQRLDVNLNKRLKQLTANEKEFKSQAEDVFHEAEILAFLSAVLTKEGMEDGDDEDYAGFANAMRDAALEIVEGVKLNDYERARKAVGAASQACDQCHESYRA